MANDFPAVSDLLADALDLSGAEISNVLDASPLVARLPFVQASNGTTHKYTTFTQNPVVGFIAENTGRDFDHSIDVIVTATLKILDFSFAVSKPTADAWRQGGASNFIAREGLRHLRSAMYTLESQIINNTDSSNGFVGLSGLSTLNGTGDAMVVNAGGTAAGTGSSVWLLREGDMEGVCGVYKGDGPMVEMGETIVQNFLDGDGKNYPAYYTPGTAWYGFQIGGAYSVSRIANLTADVGKGLTDDLLYEAYSRHPIGQAPTVVVMNRRSLAQLRDSRTATNPTGLPAPYPTDWNGLPIIVTDAISNTETLLTA
jgi:hypothetical protein